MKKSPNPLPLPTLKLSEPPGAVRPDGNQPPPLILPAPGQSPVNLINKSPIVPITIGIMLMKLNRQPRKSSIKVLNDEQGPSQAQDKLATKDAWRFKSCKQKK